MGLSSIVTRLRLKSLGQSRLEEPHWLVPVDGSGQPLGSVVDGDADRGHRRERRRGQTALTRNFSLSGYLARKQAGSGGPGGPERGAHWTDLPALAPHSGDL